MKTVTFSVFSDAKSPFWLTQLVFNDGRRLKKSTKVAVTVDLNGQDEAFLTNNIRD